MELRGLSVNQLLTTQLGNLQPKVQPQTIGANPLLPLAGPLPELLTLSNQNQSIGILRNLQIIFENLVNLRFKELIPQPEPKQFIQKQQLFTLEQLTSTEFDKFIRNFETPITAHYLDIPAISTFKETLRNFFSIEPSTSLSLTSTRSADVTNPFAFNASGHGQGNLKANVQRKTFDQYDNLKPIIDDYGRPKEQTSKTQSKYPNLLKRLLQMALSFFKRLSHFR